VQSSSLYIYRGPLDEWFAIHNLVELKVAVSPFLQSEAVCMLTHNVVPWLTQGVKDILTENIYNYKEIGPIFCWVSGSCNFEAQVWPLRATQLAVQLAAYFKFQVDTTSQSRALLRHFSTLLLTSGFSSVSAAAGTVASNLLGWQLLSLQMILWEVAGCVWFA